MLPLNLVTYYSAEWIIRYSYRLLYDFEFITINISVVIYLRKKNRRNFFHWTAFIITLSSMFTASALINFFPILTMYYVYSMRSYTLLLYRISVQITFINKLSRNNFEPSYRNFERYLSSLSIRSICVSRPFVRNDCQFRFSGSPIPILLSYMLFFVKLSGPYWTPAAAEWFSCHCRKHIVWLWFHSRAK